MKPLSVQRSAVRPRQPRSQRPASRTPKISQDSTANTVLWSKRTRAAEQRLREREAGGERQREQDERGADQPEQQALERQQRGQCAERGARRAVPAVQPALRDRHQHRVQDRDGEQAVGEHRQHQVQPKFERGGVGAADRSGEQRGQRHASAASASAGGCMASRS